MAQGMNIAEAGHVVNILPPVDIGAGATVCVPVNMENYGHCTIIIQQGVVDAAHQVTVEEIATQAGVGVAIAFTYYAEDTALGDILSARTAAGVGGFALTVNNNTMYVLEIDAAELSDGFPYIELNLAAGGANSLVSAIAILSGSRYAQAESPTAIV